MIWYLFRPLFQKWNKNSLQVTLTQLQNESLRSLLFLLSINVTFTMNIFLLSQHSIIEQMQVTQM